MAAGSALSTCRQAARAETAAADAEDEQPRLAVAEAARELAVVVAPEDEEDL